MPDLNDFYAFKNTSSGGGGGGSIFPGLLAVLAILWLIGKIFG